MAEEKPVPCPECGGQGEYLAGHVSHEMAMDGGDIALEGMPVYQKCSRCNGGGWILVEDEGEAGEP